MSEGAKNHNSQQGYHNSLFHSREVINRKAAKLDVDIEMNFCYLDNLAPQLPH
jgi:hypothetical protein